MSEQKRALSLKEFRADLQALTELFARCGKTYHLGNDFHPEQESVQAHTCVVLGHHTIRTPVLFWAALLHDVGKADTHAYKAPNIRISTFHGHEKVSAEYVERFSALMQFDGLSVFEVVRVRQIVAEHMRAKRYLSGEMSASKKLLFQQTNKGVWNDLMSLCEADDMMLTSQQHFNRMTIGGAKMKARFTAMATKASHLASAQFEATKHTNGESISS